MERLRFRSIHTSADFEALTPAWRALWARDSRATPFQTPGWTLAWWRHIGCGRLLVFAVSIEDRLVGLAPFFVDETAAGPRIGLIGEGISDYIDVLLDDTLPADIVRAGLRAQLLNAGFVEIHLRDLPSASPLIADAIGWQCDPHPGMPCPVLRLPDRIADLSSPIPRPMLQKLAYHRRLADRHGGIRVEHADRSSFERLFETLMRLHTARWSPHGQPGVLADPSIGALHREAAFAFLADGLLRLYALHIGNRIASVFYGMRSKGAFYYYLGGFDPELARFSPGTLIIGHAIEEAVRENATEFHFLRGGEAYKYRWGATDRLNVDCAIRLHYSTGTEVQCEPGLTA